MKAAHVLLPYEYAIEKWEQPFREVTLNSYAIRQLAFMAAFAVKGAFAPEQSDTIVHTILTKMWAFLGNEEIFKVPHSFLPYPVICNYT